MSRARSGSDWACKAEMTSDGVNPGFRCWIQVSNCFSRGVRVRVWIFGFGVGGLGEEEMGR